MKTEFTSRRIDIIGGEYLFLDGNSKITAGNGTVEQPAANAFSLVSIDDCPYSTEACREACYTAGLKKLAPDMFQRYAHNSKTIRAVVKRGPSSWSWHDSVTRLSAAATELPGGFRWHVSGDIWSWDYAVWIADVCRGARRTQFWIYTRSFSFVRPLLDLPNLTINLSADRDNVESARRYSRQLGLRVCYMATPHDEDGIPDWLRPGDVIFPDYAFRGRDLSLPTTAPWWRSLHKPQRQMVCPPDFFGQSPHLRCGPCRKCIDPFPRAPSPKGLTVLP